ncbi:tight adherence protein B [Marinococcus luteus]|uniref:Tight adherence protein B n=1 Tax=Marinococcus luteus TaxID=1122204 RepID=A0A1H2XRA8_9BACI|nr:type II secretion system F family protein [Marinococcus luteus]SDW95431.1 tight adherence protein B [Marinococcus luteus]
MLLTLLFIFMFLTCFLLVAAGSLAVSSNASVEAGGEAEVPKKPLSLKGYLREANGKLKLLLIRKKKPTRKKEQLEQQLSAAGVPMKAEEFRVFRWFAVIISAGLFYLITNLIGTLAIGGVIGYVIPSVWLKKKQSKRLQQFNQMLPDMLTTIIGSLRAGHSFQQSLKMVSEESDPPIKEEVYLVLKEIQYGSTMEEALNNWKRRMPSGDLELLVEALLIQRQVGGNLAYLLDKIVETTREREKIANQVKTLTAQGRLSGIIISLLPVGLGAVIYVINPEYITTLFIEPIGRIMLAVAAIGGVIGFILVRKITTIEV